MSNNRIENEVFVFDFRYAWFQSGLEEDVKKWKFENEWNQLKNVKSVKNFIKLSLVWSLKAEMNAFWKVFRNFDWLIQSVEWKDGEGEGVDKFVIIIFDDETAIIPTKTVTFFTEQQWIPPSVTHTHTH